jgi:iron(II)-dependent oxidoreductase
LIAVSICVDGALLYHTVWSQPWKHAGTQAGQEIIGPDGGKMVWVPAGEFIMGEEQEHKVRITKGFWLGKCEVTTAQWQRYLKETGVRDWPGSDDPTPGPAYPAWMISWEDAAAYCKHYGLSLPTEAQWEYAAAGPEGRTYPWGSEWDPKMCANHDNLGPDGNTWPVGSFPLEASWCGALDMAGNVNQWCQDWYDNTYYAQSPTDDPPGPDTGEARVFCGGSWADPATPSNPSLAYPATTPTPQEGAMSLDCAASGHQRPRARLGLVVLTAVE